MRYDCDSPQARTPDALDICLRAGWPLIVLVIIQALPGFAGRSVASCVLLGVFPASLILEMWRLRSSSPGFIPGRAVVLRQLGLEGILGLLLLPFLLPFILLGCLVQGLFGGAGTGP